MTTTLTDLGTAFNQLGEDATHLILLQVDLAQAAVLRDVGPHISEHNPRYYALGYADLNHPFAVYEVTNSQPHYVDMVMHDVGAWDMEGNPLLSRDEDSTTTLYIKWDGCSHFNTGGYRHVCGFGSALQTFHSHEGAFAIASRHVQTGEYDEFPIEPEYDPKFEELRFTSQTGEALVIKHIDADRLATSPLAGL